MVQRRLEVAAAVLLPLLLTSGCRDDPVEPEPLGTPTTSATPAPTRDATPQVETPEHVVRHFVRAQNEVQRSGATELFRRLTFKCVACDGFADQIEQIYADGGYVHTKGATIEFLRVSTESDYASRVFTIGLKSAPTSYVEEAGGEVQHLIGGLTRNRIELVRKSGSWKVHDFAEYAS